MADGMLTNQAISSTLAAPSTPSNWTPDWSQPSTPPTVTPGWMPTTHPPEPAIAAERQAQPYQAPTATPAQSTQQHALGQSGIEFGGGAFTWSQHPDGQWGWSAPDGRTFDATGAPRQQAQAAAQPLPNATHANAFQDFLGKTPPNAINSYQFNKLRSSTKDFVLGGYESLGFDKGDVNEQIQKMLPTATGPKTGYVAPLSG